MTTQRTSDILFYAGGMAALRTGTLLRRTTTPARGGEAHAPVQTQANRMWVMNAEGLYVPMENDASTGAPVGWWDLDGDGVLETPGLFSSLGNTNAADQSTPGNDDTHWSNSTGFTLTAITTPLILGTSPYLHTATAFDERSQAQGTFTANEDCLSAIFEFGGAVETRLAVYDTTASSFVARVRLTWSSGAVDVTDGNATIAQAVKLRERGPSNTGAVYWLGLRTSGVVNGNNRRIYFYDDTGGVIVHHILFEAGQLAPSMLPVVTPAATNVTDGVAGMRWAWNGPVGDFQIYHAFVETGGVRRTDGACWQLGHAFAAATTPPYLRVFGGTSYYRSTYHDGVNAFTLNIDNAPSPPTYGQLVETLVTIEGQGDDRTFTFAQRIAGGTIYSKSDAAVGQGTAFKAWAGPTISLGGFNPGNGAVNQSTVAFIGSLGTDRSMDDFYQMVRA